MRRVVAAVEAGQVGKRRVFARRDAGALIGFVNPRGCGSGVHPSGLLGFYSRLDQ